MHFSPLSTMPRVAVLILTAAIAAAPAYAASPLSGTWVGIFDAAGPKFVHTRFSEDGGKLTGKLDMPANERRDLALDNLTLEGNRLQFQMMGPDGPLLFDGKLVKDTVSGTVSANGKRAPFTLQRSLPATAQSDQRFLGAYRFPNGRTIILSHLGDFPQLFYTDLSNGRYAALFPTAQDSFFAGAGFLNPSVRELSVQFTTAPDGSVKRMAWKQAGKPVERAEKLAFRSRDVRFNNGDVTLSGTVVLPAGKGPHPAVVLTQMSSPAPRSAYALQAYYFASNGIAALMYDKRGVGLSSGDWQKATMQDLADDAVAGMKLLAADPQINAAKIGTWGHSQGGWLAPLAAVRSGQAAFVVAQAASAVTPAEQEIYRIENSMRASHFSETDIAAAVAYERLLMHWVSSGGEGRSELLAAARAGDKARWANEVELLPDTMRAKPRETTTAFYRYDPMPDLRALKVPTLVLLGDKDTFVPVAKSAVLFKEAFAAANNEQAEVWMLPNATHGLWEVESGGANDFVNSRFWAKEHYPRMTAWLLKHGIARKQ